MAKKGKGHQLSIHKILDCVQKSFTEISGGWASSASAKMCSDYSALLYIYGLFGARPPVFHSYQILNYSLPLSPLFNMFNPILHHGFLQFQHCNSLPSYSHTWFKPSLAN